MDGGRFNKVQFRVHRYLDRELTPFDVRAEPLCKEASQFLGCQGPSRTGRIELKLRDDDLEPRALQRFDLASRVDLGIVAPFPKDHTNRLRLLVLPRKERAL